MDERYPIGKFQWTGPNTPEQRQEFITQIAGLPTRLREAVAGLTEEQLDTPYRDGGWSVRQVVHHLPDSHMNALIRFKLALTENEPVIKPYKQDAWARLADSRGPVSLSLQMIEALHQRWELVLRSMSAEDFERKLTHPEQGLVALDRFLALYAWHGAHHVGHITQLRRRMGWE